MSSDDQQTVDSLLLQSEAFKKHNLKLATKQIVQRVQVLQKSLQDLQKAEKEIGDLRSQLSFAQGPGASLLPKEQQKAQVQMLEDRAQDEWQKVMRNTKAGRAIQAGSSTGVSGGDSGSSLLKGLLRGDSVQMADLREEIQVKRKLLGDMNVYLGNVYYDQASEQRRRRREVMDPQEEQSALQKAAQTTQQACTAFQVAEKYYGEMVLRSVGQSNVG